MHRSRLTAIGIDVPLDRYDATAAFWAGALGAEPHTTGKPDDPYTDLGRGDHLEVFVQAIGAEDPPRVHLDIETDDIEAEVQRLEALGATRVRQVGWWIMRDPAGLLFCVVRPQSKDFPGDNSRTWD